MFTQVTLNRTATYTTDAAAYSVNGYTIKLAVRSFGDNVVSNKKKKKDERTE